MCDVAKQRGREGRDSARQINRAQAEEAERLAVIEAERARLEAEMQAIERAEYKKKVEAHQKSLAEFKKKQEAFQKSLQESKQRNQPAVIIDPNYDGKKMCRNFPEARSYQECQQKMKLERTCRQNPTLAECSR